MVGIFRNYNPFGIIFLFFYGLVLRFASFILPHVPQIQHTDGFLYKSLLRFLDPIGSSTPVIYPILAYLLIFIQAMMVNGAVNNHRMLGRSTFLPAMAYILISALFPEWWAFSAALVVNTFLVWIWSQLTGLYNNPRPQATIFTTGIILGISSLFYFPTIFFVLLLFLALIVMRPFKLAEWLIALVSISIPYYFLFAWLYLNNSWNLSDFLPKLTLQYPSFMQNIWAWGGIVLLILPFIGSGYYIQGNILRMLIQVRKSWSLALLYLLTALLIPFINVNPSFSFWILCAPPFAAFHANVYQHAERRVIPVLLHWVTVAFILGLNYWMIVGE